MAKKEKANDALDIVFIQIERLKETLLNYLVENEFDEKIILDVVEMFHNYLKI